MVSALEKQRLATLRENRKRDQVVYEVGASLSNTPFSVFVTTFQSVFGSGFFALPFAVSSAGMVGGLSILLVVWLFTNVTMRQLVECADVVKANNPRLPVGLIDYSAIGHAAYGRPGKCMCMVPVLLTQFFCGCGYLVFIKTMLSPWFGSDLAALMFTLVIQVALAMRPTPSFLVGVAKMGNFFLVAAVTFAVYHGWRASPPQWARAELFRSWGGCYVCFGIAVFTYSAHAQSVSIYGTAGPRARAAYPAVIDAVLALSAGLLVFFAVFNYLCYGDGTRPIIFDNLGGSALNALVKVCTSLMLFCNFPISVYPVHHALEVAFQLVNMPSVNNLAPAQVLGNDKEEAVPGEQSESYAGGSSTEDVTASPESSEDISVPRLVKSHPATVLLKAGRGASSTTRYVVLPKEEGLISPDGFLEEVVLSTPKLPAAGTGGPPLRSPARLEQLVSGAEGTGLLPGQKASRVSVVLGAGLVAFCAGRNFGHVLAVMGGFNGVMAFVAPPLSHAALARGGGGRVPVRERWANAVLVLCGVVGGVGSLWQGVVGLLRGAG